ncbi:right-handed parallel beta-helix repeat-containing protein [Pararcticibacter amylolyticus]|uniref:Right-handed parallel beta-helix repeat-containing protein n=1 Tax=Pararcticibacter amylolyticus TaxID=2173175 RepID=A0A2U2PHC5_9SPHI|nr:right-handed parallel beta-helix repeat-containing protein [Pararcticibacter amylolyticus]PWG80815.1 right-handed parallel beta-helix repeat-containing protein [Pararcticibacter amylolyticus]
MMSKKLLSLLAVMLCATRLIAAEYHVAKNGSNANPGTKSTPFLTINHAAALARPGDVVTVHAGTYREWVAPAFSGTDADHRITFRAAPGELVEIKGSEVVRDWASLGNGVWEKRLPDRFFGEYNPYNDIIFGDWFFPKEMQLHTGEVYLNGKALEERLNVRDENSWSCRYSGDSTVIQANFGNTNPNNALVEINVRPACFYPQKTGVNYITVRGFHLSQAATQWAPPTAEQVGLIGTNWSKGWVIEDNVISDSKCVGITLGKDRASGQNVWSADMSKDGSVVYNEMIIRVIAGGWNKGNIGSHLVRNNKIYNCGAAGICGSFGAAYSRILNNVIHDIYKRRNFYGAEMAGMKFHGAIDIEISGNRVHGAFVGLWLDWMAQGTLVKKNVFYDNDYVDFFPEVNHGRYTVIGNQFLSGFSLRDWSENGIYRKNTFAGMLSRAPQERVTPVFKDHTTELLAVKPILGGANQFYKNNFKEGDGKAMQPKMHQMDTMDALRGYGLAIYQESAIPIIAKGNKYLKGGLKND